MFSGLISLRPGECPIVWRDEARLAAPFAVFGAPDIEGAATDQAAALYERRRSITAADRDLRVPLRCPESGAWIAFWGRIDNRCELAQKVGLEPSRTDAALVAAAWRRFGRSLPAHLIGDFAIAVVDPVRRSVFLARDPMGVKPLYYRHGDGVFAFASTAEALKIPGLPLTPDREWIARFLWANLSADPVRTAYREMRKLPGGHWLSIEAGAEPHVERWHHWRDDQPAASRRDPAWVEAYRHTLEEAVACRTASDHPIGVETSGGIDSSTVLAYAARSLGTPAGRLRAYGFAMAEDEPDFILATSQAYRVRHTMIVAGGAEPAEADRRRVLAAIGYPEEHGNASAHSVFYQDAQNHGLRTLLSGFGGDEIVTNPGFQAQYEMAAAQAWGPLVGMKPGSALLRPLRAMKQILRPVHPVPYRPQFIAAWRQRWPSCILRDDVIEEFGIERAYFDTARYDGPYTRVNDFILGHHLAEMRVTTRLENCTLAAAAWGVDYRWPLWDVRLVQQYLSTPAIEKFGPKGIGRYLHRRAVDGVVPAKVTWKPSKDMGAPAVRGVGSMSSDAARTIRDRLPTCVAEVVDIEKIDRQIAVLATGAGEAARRTAGTTFRAMEQLERWLAE